MDAKKFKTYAVARFELIDTPAPTIKAQVKAAVQTLGTSQKELLDFALENKQEDLQYFKAVYATCGFNLNDDVFINDEFWAARKSPVLKPTNWQHKDKDIIGVIYAVEAQLLDGTPIDIESEKTPTEDFELVVHGVVYKYTFAKLAEEIEKRSKAGELYVSMETWFSDFAYALLDPKTQQMKVVARNERTAALDKYLKCHGGVGQYNGQRVGRVLKGMTFGGMGIVDQPANPRSGGTVQASEVEEIMENKMADIAEVKNAVKAELDERAKAEQISSLESQLETLKKDNTTASENAQRASDRAKQAEEAKTVTEAILSKIEKAMDDAVAGVGSAAPAEIAKIDSAKTADEKFAAKLAFLAQTGKALSEKAEADKVALQKEVDTLKAKVAEFEAAKAAAEKAARTENRKKDLKAVLGDGSDEAVEKLLKNLADLDDAAYAGRLEEIKIVAAKARPEVRHDGAQGKPDAEGASGEGKAATGPREDRKINVAAALEKAAVEQVIEPKGGEGSPESPFKGLAGLVLSKKDKEE